MDKQDADASAHEQYQFYTYRSHDSGYKTERLIIGSPGRLAKIEYYAICLLDVICLLVAEENAIRSKRNSGGVHSFGYFCHFPDITYSRLEIHDLGNVEFRQASLVDLSKLSLEKFDYINCCDVLRHLDVPLEELL